MKYLKAFFDAFAESFAHEAAVQLSYLFVWGFRGIYFGLGFVTVFWLLGWWK